MSTHLPSKLLGELSERIEVAMGLYFPPDRFADLDRKIRLAARELAFLDLEGFVRQLLGSPFTNEQIRALAGYLTIGETYFYREPQTWEILRSEILPPLIASRLGRNQSLRFWSAACSSGEEAYSLAMTLTELLPQVQSWQSVILATDLNPHALRRALAGIYSAWSFRTTSPAVRARFFCSTDNKQFAIHPDIKNMVTFIEANLVSSESIPHTHMMDVIFCRNVLFYFTPERAKRVLERCYDSLITGGWLIVSPVETTYLNDMPFVPVLINGTTVYRKEARPSLVQGAGERSSHAALSAASAHAFSVSSPSVSSPLPLCAPSHLSAVPPAPCATTVPPGQKENVPGSLTLTPYAQAHAVYAQGQYEQVIALLLPQCETNEIALQETSTRSANLMLLARAYANQGYLTEARTWCEMAIGNDRMNPGLHYLLATILLEQERIPDATRALRSAIYADPDFVLAHFALGNLLLQQQRVSEARRYLMSAFVILQRTPTDEVIPESEGLTAGRLADLVNTMLRK